MVSLSSSLPFLALLRVTDRGFLIGTLSPSFPPESFRTSAGMLVVSRATGKVGFSQPAQLLTQGVVVDEGLPAHVHGGDSAASEQGAQGVFRQDTCLSNLADGHEAWLLIFHGINLLSSELPQLYDITIRVLCQYDI